jgi:hypothetical protein
MNSAHDLTCIKYNIAKSLMLNQSTRENIMPIESALVSVFVLVVFTGFALVLAWAEHQTRGL